MRDQAQEHRAGHVGQRVADRDVHGHEHAVEHEAQHPDDGVAHIELTARAAASEQEEVRDLDGDHRREHRADQVQEVRDVVHREADGADRADDGHDERGVLAVDLLRQGLGGDAGAVRIEERRRDGREDEDEQRGHAEAGLDHDERDVALAGEDGGAHADDVHPAAHDAVGQRARERGGEGLFGLARVVGDERQPRQRHGHGQLDRCAEAQAVVRRGDGRAAAEHHHAQHDREDEQRRHGDLVDPAEVLDADGDPHHDEPADDETPHPLADAEHGVRGQCAVIDHDGRPADELQHVERGEKQAADAAEAQLDRAHGAAAGAAADEAREEEHRTANDMADEDGEQALREAEGRKVRACEDLRDGHGRAEPDEAVLEAGSLFHAQASCRYSGFRSNAWSIGPEPAPRSSMAASAPER